MKKVLLLVVLLFGFLVLPSGVWADGFSDVSGHWAEETITWGAEAGYVNGYPDGSFRPNHAITQAEYYRLSHQFLRDNPDAFHRDELPSVVPPSDPSAPWYQVEIDYGRALGYLPEGFPQDPNVAITRQEAVRILAHIAMWVPNVGEAEQFSDFQLIDPGNRGAVGAAASQGILEGYPDGRFGANDSLTRAEVVTLLYRMVHPEGPVEEEENWYWKFKNVSENFFENYYITGEDFNKGYIYLSNIDMSAIYQMVYGTGEWQGSGFGFSHSAADYKGGFFFTHGLNTQAVSALGEVSPQDELYRPQSAINFHTMLQFTRSYRNFVEDHGVGWHFGGAGKDTPSSAEFGAWITAALDEAKAVGDVLPLGYYHSGIATSVVAYDYEDREDSIFVHCYDSNDPGLIRTTGIAIYKDGRGVVAHSPEVIRGKKGPEELVSCYFTPPLKFLSRSLRQGGSPVVIADRGKALEVSNGKSTLALNLETGIPSFDGQKMIYALPDWDRYVFSGPGIQHLMLDTGEEFYAAYVHAADHVTFAQGSIIVENESGFYQLLQSKNDPGAHFSFDRVEIKGYGGGDMTFGSTETGYFFMASQWEGIDVLAKRKGEEVVKLLDDDFRGESLLIEEVGGILQLEEGALVGG
ncbi:MAG: S-layer homology domain-containing protein [Tissierellia bacterium]|nr:S-layer homology domain-containing protein [Tissierellia bacterium]